MVIADACDASDGAGSGEGIARPDEGAAGDWRARPRRWRLTSRWVADAHFLGRRSAGLIPAIRSTGTTRVDHPTGDDGNDPLIERELDVQRNEIERDERPRTKPVPEIVSVPAPASVAASGWARARARGLPRRGPRHEGEGAREKNAHGISSSVHGVRHGSARSYSFSRAVSRAFAPAGPARSAAATRSR